MYVRNKERKAKTAREAQRRNNQHEPLSFDPRVKGQGSKFGAPPVRDLAYKWCNPRSSRLFRSIHQAVISLLRQSLLANRYGSHRRYYALRDIMAALIRRTAERQARQAISEIQESVNASRSTIAIGFSIG